MAFNENDHKSEKNRAESALEESHQIRAESGATSDVDLVEMHGAILREKDDPKEGAEPIPLWLMTFFGLIVFWAGAYLFLYSGGFRSDVFDEKMVTWGPVQGGAKVAAADPVVLGKRLFTANCAACHQASGEGVPGQYPSLVGAEMVVGQGGYGQNHLVKVVLNGLAGPLQVKGVSYNGSMPPWKDVLTDEQIAHILTYIRQAWGNNAPPISKEGVAAMRAESGTRSQPWSDAALKAIPAADLPAPAATPTPTSAPPAAGTQPPPTAPK